MKNERILDALEKVDEELLMEAAPGNKPPKKTAKKMAWIKWAAMAACFCLVVTTLSLTRQHGKNTPLTPEETLTVPKVSSEGEKTVLSTSDTYQNLEKLLAYLSGHDSHDDRKADAEGGSVNMDAFSIAESRSAVSYGEYSYQLNTDDWTVDIYRSEAGVPEQIGSIDFAAQYLFQSGNQLIIAGSYQSGGTELDYEMSADIRIYSLEDPKRPEPVDRFTQRGEISACYMIADRLYLMTSDGMCACGWSRLEDTSGYIPQMTHEDVVIEWTDDEISILGNPTLVQYTAVSILDVSASRVAAKHAFYGNLQDVFYGEDWLAVSTGGMDGSAVIHPDLYTFDIADDFRYTGKLSTAAMFGLPDSVKLQGDSLPHGEYPSIESVTKVGEEYRMIGYYQTNAENSTTPQLLVIVMNMESCSYNYEVMDCTGYPHFTIDEILWEESRAIVSASVIENFPDNLDPHNHFLFVEFRNGEIVLYENEILFDHVAGVDMMYGYGSPFGHIKTLISLGNGIYLRYNSLPDGLDIYDFSDSAAPVCLYRSSGDIPDGCRLEFENIVYDEITIGILKITPDENGEYRNVTYTWCVYEVDLTADTPFGLVSESVYGSGLDPYTLHR